MNITKTPLAYQATVGIVVAFWLKLKQERSHLGARGVQGCIEEPGNGDDETEDVE